ncbi:flagellar hook-length control protein FliK [Helicobacter ganmani]|uniref:flagellar hook-length control protein FliK n=1 Tax=Helicobacter ganmani TaxID=60246 RepID=UPI003A8977DE
MQAKAQEPSKEIPKQEVGKQDFVVKNEIKHEEKVKEKTNQEEMLKESQNTKVASQSKATQESLRNPFALKEQKEVKESFLKEEKEDKRNIKNSKTTTTQSLNTLGNAFKEENIKQDIKQQDIFLENLLKTTEKSAQSSKETSKEAMLEVSKENTEKKAKINQEIYQASTQAQVENRLSVQNTFLHFSDKLREALQNYRPPITRLSLELNPENLGSVELTITKRGENVSVQITSNQTALQLFMQNAQEFKNSLSNLGLNDVNLEFKDNAGNLLDNGDFNGSNGGNSGGFGGQNQGENPRKEQNLTQNSDENSQNTQKWNENSLHIYKEVNNPYAKVALVEINFSYYA